MEKTQYDGNQVVAWADVGWKPKGIVQPQAKKLSQIIRQFGYGKYTDISDCVLARSYRIATGGDLCMDGFNFPYSGRHFVAHAAKTFSIPYDVADETETMCMNRKPPKEIADWLESQGY